MSILNAYFIYKNIANKGLYGLFCFFSYGNELTNMLVMIDLFIFLTKLNTLDKNKGSGKYDNSGVAGIQRKERCGLFFIKKLQRMT